MNELKNMETQNIEYKVKWKDEYLHYISGFANADGGTLFIGLDDNGSIVGIDNAEQLLVNLPNKAVQATGIVPEVNLLSDNGKEYIAIHVLHSEQPVSCNGKYYLRSGSTLQELNGAALTEFLMRKTKNAWDKQIEPEATLEDIDSEAVEYFIRAALRKNRIDQGALNDNIEKVLRNLDLMNKQGQLTNAALLLFGKNIRHWCRMATFRIGRFGASRADLIMQDEIDCPLIKMPDKIIGVLRSGYLVSPIHYEGLQRIEPLEIPEDALREMICNAIVHRDYTGTFTQMRIWADHIELWNQGTLPPDYTIDTLMQDHESYPRNTLIADAFFRAGFIEAWGRGYEKIREAFKDEQLQMPTFEQVRGGVLATIKREKFIAMQQQKDGASGASNVVSDVVSDVVSQLTETQREIIKLIQANPFMSATQMSQVMSVVPRTVQRQLAALQKQGIIIREGNTSAKKWIVSDNVSDIPNEQL